MMAYSVHQHISAGEIYARICTSRLDFSLPADVLWGSFSLCSMAVLSGALYKNARESVRERAANPREKYYPCVFRCSRPNLLSSPNQNRHATQARVRSSRIHSSEEANPDLVKDKNCSFRNPV